MDVETLQVVAGVIRKGGTILIAQRKDDCKREPGKWEFPGGKIEPGETPERALMREIMEELGVGIEVGAELCQTSAESGETRIMMRTFLADWRGGKPKALDCKDFRWVGIEDLGGFDWAKADLPVIEKLRGMEGAGGAGTGAAANQ
jgi:8-oxo-dGTP diphosphatase